MSYENQTGAYTPTLTDVTNIAAKTAYSCKYVVCANMITVLGKMDIDPTSTGDTEIRMTLPFATTLTNDYDLVGEFTFGTVNEGGIIYADTTNDEASFKYLATDTSNKSCFFSLHYLMA